MVLVLSLVIFAVGNIIENVYSAIDPYISDEEKAELREQRYADLGHCPAPKPEELEVPVEEVQKDYFDTQACVSDTSVASSIKSNNKMIKDVRASGGVKKPFEPVEKPSSSPCSKTDKKVIAEQARNGAKTEGLSEGKDGAETSANQPGSTAEYALVSQNLQTCHEQKMDEMGQVGPSFNLYCKENPEFCTQSASRWYAPIAVAQAQVGYRNFSTYHSKRVQEIETSKKESRQVEERARQERATYERYNYLSQALKTVADKSQEINAKAEVMMIAFQAYVEKFDQGGTSHNATSL